MSREEVSKKSICASCAFCKQISREHDSWTEYLWYCTNSVVFLNPVTGDEEYAQCISVNDDGLCKDYQKIDKFEGIFKALRKK